MKIFAVVLAMLLISTAVFLSSSSYVYADEGYGTKGKYKSRFDKMDSNTDGKVSQKEFMDYWNKRGDEKFRKKDLDGDGYISKEEDIKAMKQYKEKKKEGIEKLKEETGGYGSPAEQ